MVLSTCLWLSSGVSTDFWTGLLEFSLAARPGMEENELVAMICSKILDIT